MAVRHARTQASFTLIEMMIVPMIIRIDSAEYIAPIILAEYLPASCRV